MTITAIDIPLPPGATETDFADRPHSSVVLELHGVRAAATYSRKANLGGVLAVTASEATDSTMILTVQLATLSAYQVTVLPNNIVHVVVAGTGEEAPPRPISLIPDRQIAVVGSHSPPPPNAPGLAKPQPATTSAAGPLAGPDSGLVTPSRGLNGRELHDSDHLNVDELTTMKLVAWDSQATKSGGRISCFYDNTPLADAVAGIARATGHSIVAGLGTDSVRVSGSYQNATWTSVIRTFAAAYGLRIRVSPGDIITLEQGASVTQYDQTAPLETRIYKVAYVTPDKLVDALMPLLTDKRGKVTTIAAQREVIVRDLPDVLDRVGQLIRIIDHPDKQFRVTSMIVSINRTDALDLGLTTDVANLNKGNSLGGIPLPTQSTTQTATATGTSGSTGTGTDGLPPGVMTGDPNYFNINRARTSSAGAIIPPAVASPALRLLLTRIAGNYSIATLFEALESQGIAKVVARQTTFCREGETCSALSGVRTPLRTVGFATGTGQGVGSAIGQSPNGGGDGGSPIGSQSNLTVPGNAVGLEETGTKLSITAHAEPDSMISLNVMVEQSAAVPSGLGDAGVQFTVNRQENIWRARDGETKVIGGLQDAIESRTSSGIPVLSRIPILGALFRGTSTSHSNNVLLILVTAQMED